MIRLALKGLLARPSRTILTALAIVLGVAMIAAAFTLTDTMGRAADELSAVGLRRHRRRGRRARRRSSATTTTCSSSRRSRPPSLDQVRARAGRRRRRRRHHRPRRRSSAPTASSSARARGSASASTRPRRPRSGLTPFRLTQGRWATGPGRGRHRRRHRREAAPAASATRIRIAGAGPAQPFRVTGLATFGSVKTIGTATTAIFDLHDGAEAVRQGRPRGRHPRRRQPGVTPGAGAPEPGRGAARRCTSTPRPHQDRFTLDGLKGFVEIIKIVLLAFGGDRARRRGVHDLQLAVDHRRPALA